MNPKQFSVILLCVVLTGCGDGRVEVQPVRGRVLVKGQPAGNASVLLAPKVSEGELAKLRPTGRSDAEGYFQLSTYGGDDGAPAGEYRVGVTWNGMSASPTNDPEGSSAGSEDKLRGKYADPETSGLTVTIELGKAELPPLELP